MSRKDWGRGDVLDYREKAYILYCTLGAKKRIVNLYEYKGRRQEDIEEIKEAIGTGWPNA